MQLKSILHLDMSIFGSFLMVHKDAMNFAARTVTYLYQCTGGDAHIEGLSDHQLPHSSLSASGRDS